PTSNQLHDLLDYFFRSGLCDNPFFSFKGRTLGSVVYLMNQWHHEQHQLEQLRILEYRLRAEERAREQRISYENAMKHPWAKRNYDYTHKNMFVFKELITAQDLMEEGRAQHNCVFSYHQACLSGKTSIVSMRGICSGEHLTIEINNSTRSIVQIREVCNAQPTREEMRIVRNFASVKNLIICC
ncbi:MAG: PcfJ domain-containing protein, partial [Victivallales bacterium]|nr:PcfJ domain-containing protein [Victivallales bacterium]